jgi:V8-like Glu-specific endopeptidase
MKILLAILVCLSASVVQADVVNSMQSVCMIHAAGEGDRGSGVVYEESEDYFYVLTAGHVITKNSKLLPDLYAYFYKAGEPSGPFLMEMVKLDYNAVVDMTETLTVRDLAILKVKKSLLKKEQYPTVIPLDEKFDIKLNQQILSIGCPGPTIPLRYPSMVHGKIKEIKNEGFTFTPNVLAGRSGSPVFDIKGDKIIGIVIWTTRNGGRAIAMAGMTNHFLD